MMGCKSFEKLIGVLGSKTGFLKYSFWHDEINPEKRKINVVIFNILMACYFDLKVRICLSEPIWFFPSLSINAIPKGYDLPSGVVN
jgi:hypothetical protein